MKAELVQKLEENRDELFAALEGLSDEQRTTVPVVGEWTIKDVVGHIAYCEGVLLDQLRETYTQGRPRPMRDDESIDVINRREAAKRKNRPWSRVRVEFENVRRALIDKVNGIPESDLEFQVPSPWWNENRFYSVGQMIQEDAVGHSCEHLGQIVRWKQGR